jgi:hypothetical protein
MNSAADTEVGRVRDCGDWAAVRRRLLSAPKPTTGAAARRDAEDAQVAADESLAAPYGDVDEAEAQGAAYVELQRIADERRDLARRLEVAERGRALSASDELRGVIAATRRRRGAEHRSRHNDQTMAVARPLPCGARARSSRGSAARTRGSRRGASRSASGDGSGEPEPPRRPLRDLVPAVATAVLA